MPSKEIDKSAAATLATMIDKPAWAAIQSAKTEQERYEAAQLALSSARFTRTGKEIPALALDLPWADDSSAVENILTQLILAPDIAEATGEQAELRKVRDILNQGVMVFDIRVRESDVEGDGSWGVYVSLEVSVGGAAREIVNTGARQVIVTMWRLYCEGALPVQGAFIELGNPTPGRSRPVGFRVETPLA